MANYKVLLEKVKDKSLCKHYIDDKVLELKRPLIRLYHDYNLSQTFNGSQNNLSKYFLMFPSREKKLILRKPRFYSTLPVETFVDDPHTRSLIVKCDKELLPLAS